jgi:hypothetical protein
MGTERSLRGAVAALAVGTLLLAGCSGSTGSDAAAGSSTTTTSRPTTSVSTTSTVPQLRAAMLPSCQPGAAEFTTVPDWVTGTLPAGTTLTKGSTTGTTGLPAGAPMEFTTLLLGPNDGTQLPTISVYRTTGSVSTNQGWNSSAPMLSTVRGRPGTVGQTVSRSGAGPTTAVWEEDGATWTATSNLGVGALAKALEGLTPAAEGVTDPSGSFTQVGTGPRYATGAARVTELQVRTAASSPAEERVLYIRIDPAAPGTTGPLRIPTAGVTSTAKVDGRIVLLNPFQATSSIDDGSQVEIRAYDGESMPSSLDPATAKAVFAGLHRRGPADDELVNSLSLGDAVPDGAVPPGFCREG